MFLLDLFMSSFFNTLLVLPLQLKSVKDPESTSSGHSPDLTLTSRPMSEESSLWDDTDTEVRRRQHKVQVSFFFREITLYFWVFWDKKNFVKFLFKVKVGFYKIMFLRCFFLSWNYNIFLSVLRYFLFVKFFFFFEERNCCLWKEWEVYLIFQISISWWHFSV